jgi:hypothetical protein
MKNNAVLLINFFKIWEYTIIITRIYSDNIQ